MQTYRIKARPQIKVEAEQLTAENVDRLANLCQGQIVEEGRDKGSMREGINVRTPNGKERLHQGMYLVSYDGNFYTAAAVNFEMRYELDSDGEIDDSTHRKMTDDPWKDIPRIKDKP